MRRNELHYRAVVWMSTVVAVSAILFGLLDAGFPLPQERLHPKPSQVIADRNGDMLRAILAPDEMWRIPVEFDSVSAALKQAILAHEDRYFQYHPGINPFSIVRALVANIRAGRVVQGGSTITMQVARLIEPKNRTIGGKLIEVFRSAQIEMSYSKNEILEFYFNLAPYGGNIVGVGAASYFYFGKKPSQLSIGDAALLASIPESPNRLRPDVRHNAARDARNIVLDELQEQSTITSAQRMEALSEAVPSEFRKLPFEIPHLSTLLSRSRAGSGSVTTTIDIGVQRLAEESLRKELEPLRSKGINNGSVVVIENASCDVLAMVGSRDFFDAESNGQINGALARRSPGSALKPFVYAIGLSRGLISPNSIVFDVPVSFSGYSPKNYDEKYHGAISARDALTRSLNVPAVRLSAALGDDGLYEFMRNAGIHTLQKPEEHYGLALALGGCEVTLLELTSLYSGIANLGSFRCCRLVVTDRLPAQRRLLSEESCYILSEMLAERKRPDLPVSREWINDVPKVAWKTGTSYRRRDAWCIGYTPRYTVGVWVGNFDGRGVAELVGSDVAAPVMFGIISSLEKKSGGAWFAEPTGVGHRQVCSVSGMPMSERCSSPKDELYIPGVSPSAECDVHQTIMVDKVTGHRLCKRCCRGRDYDERTVEQWPVELATWMERNGYPVLKIPEHNPDCCEIMAGRAPLICSPQAGSEYKLRSGVGAEYQEIPLDVSVSNRTGSVFWFLDGELVYSGPGRNQVFIKPTFGVHTIVCSDDEGRSSEVTFFVR